MKVNYEELMQYYEAARNKTPGEWEDAIEAILDAVPELIAQNRDLQEKVQELELKNTRLDAGNRYLIEELDELERELHDVKEGWKL